MRRETTFFGGGGCIGVRVKNYFDFDNSIVMSISRMRGMELAIGGN